MVVRYSSTSEEGGWKQGNDPIGAPFSAVAERVSRPLKISSAGSQVAQPYHRAVLGEISCRWFPRGGLRRTDTKAQRDEASSFEGHEAKGS